MADIVTPFESETDKAARHKAALAELLKPVADACEAARKDGFYPDFQVQLNPFGMYTVGPVSLVKRF